MIDLNYPWKYKELTNWNFDHQELVNYYEEIKKNFQHRKWSMDVIEPCEYQYIQKKMHGYECWSIQTRYKDPTKPCGIFRGDEAPWEVLDGDTYDGTTEMAFGFAKKLIDRVPGIYQMGLSCHNPGFEIAQHQDFEFTFFAAGGFSPGFDALKAERERQKAQRAQKALSQLLKPKSNTIKPIQPIKPR
jgi:hypothetical protein